MRIAITGAAGWLGGKLADYLEANGYEVVRIDHPDKAYGTVGWDICEPVPDHPWLNDIDCVFHFAAMANVNDALNNPIGCVKANVLGTANVLDWVSAMRIKMFYISSAWCESWPDNAHPYTATKLTGEFIVHSWVKTYAINAAVIRLGTLYGPGGRDGTAITNFVGKCLVNKPIKIFGDGRATRRYLHVDDMCRGLEKAIHRETGSILDVCGHFNISVNYLAAACRRLICNVPIEYLPSRVGDLDQEKAHYYDETCRVLDWKPEIAIEDGIKQYAEWRRGVHVSG